MAEQAKTHSEQQNQQTVERPGLTQDYPVGPVRVAARPGPEADIMDLQDKAGNRAVSELLQPEMGKGRQIQFKLTLGRPGDKYEQEADRVSEQIMREPVSRIQRQAGFEEDEEEEITAPSEPDQEMPVTEEQGEGERPEEEDVIRPKLLPGLAPYSIQRQPEPEEEEIEEEEEPEEEIRLQPRQAQSRDATLRADLAAQIQSIRGSGRPLPESTRAFFESKFGQDFGEVRIHTDGRASETARAVGAYAYTLGPDIVFGAGQYSPGSRTGLQLLAHELSHVVQQGQSTDLAPAAPFQSSHLSGRQTGQPAAGPAGVQRSAAAPASPLNLTPASGETVQRDEEPKLKSGLGAAGQKATREAITKMVMEPVTEIEENWKQLRESGNQFDELKEWLTKGDRVVKLLREHTEAALEAILKSDSKLAEFLTGIVKTDMIMYEFVAWQVALQVNLLALEPQLSDLSDAFDADGRQFTGRDRAEEILSLLQKLAEGFPDEAAEYLAFVEFKPAEVTRSGNRKLQLTVTVAAIPDVAKFLEKETKELIELQSATQTLVTEINRFLATATKEGVVQAGEALVEFITARGGRRGRGPKVSKGSKRPKKSSKKKKKKKKKEDPEKVRRDIRRLLKSPFLKRGKFAQAGGSVAAQSPDRVLPDEQRKINEFGNKFGDHHTNAKTPGTTSGNWIGDHIPVTELVRMAQRDRELKTMMTSARLPTTLNNQRLYPHSLSSARIQGGTVTAIQLKLRKLKRLKGR